MRITVAVLDKKGDEAPTAAIATIKSLQSEKDGCFGVASPNILMMERDVSRLQKKDMQSTVAIASVFSEPPKQVSAQFMKLEDAAFAFEGRIYSPNAQKQFAESIAEKSQQERENAIESLLKKSEGDFALVIAEPERILAARDPVGVQPFYYGENDAHAAFGSNRKVLWKLGIEKTNSFPPGHVAVASREGFKFKPIKSLAYAESKPTTMKDAACTLQKLLERSVRMRVQDVKDVAVAFSGGLDSSVVAFLAKKCGVKVHLVHVSLMNQAETDEAKKAADELKLPLSVYLFQEEDVANAVARVVELIEEPDPVKVAIGIPFYWTAQKTVEAGFKVLLAGQGADELFGGYQRYVNEYCLWGEEKTRRTMFADVARIHESNLERDEKICGFLGVELRLPFASYQIAEFATSLPMEFKIDARADSLRKLVLRRVAENLGLPTSIAQKPKKAVQYATGVNYALKKLAKKERTSVSEYVSRFFVR